MGILAWLEKKFYLREIIKDYGIVAETPYGIYTERVSLILCRRQGEEQLAIRLHTSSPLSFHVQYAFVPARDIPRMQDILSEISGRH